jgi:Polyketide cyclase / dehydrase and lipid transport
MTDVPNATALTSAPLRHRLRVELNAPVPRVWSMVGDHRRLPEYSEGIERVVVTEGGTARVCHFRAPDGASDGIVLRERIRWEAPDVGYSTSAEEPNEFGLANDLSIVTVAPAAQGTLFTWEQYYDHPDLPAMRAGFDQGVVDIGQRLIAAFGGRILERYVDGPLRYAAV